MGVFDKIFGTRSQREIKKIQPTVDKILALEDEYKALSEEALKAKTAEFKNRLDQGETLDDLLPEAFAACREAADRVLGMRHFPVQVMGGIILHQGPNSLSTSPIVGILLFSERCYWGRAFRKKPAGRRRSTADT